MNLWINAGSKYESQSIRGWTYWNIVDRLDSITEIGQVDIKLWQHADICNVMIPVVRTVVV